MTSSQSPCAQDWSTLVMIFTTHQTQFTSAYTERKKQLSIGNYIYIHSILNFIFWNGKKKERKNTLGGEIPEPH